MLSRHSFQRIVEDAGRAAAAHQVPAGDHRSAKGAGNRAVALPAVQPEAHVEAADSIASAVFARRGKN